MTIYALAQDLDVHPSTVSRAFSRPDLIRPDVRERILQRAAELHYRPNRAARSLVTGRTQMIGLLIPDVENPFFPPLIRAVQNAATQRGLGTILLDADIQPDRETDLLSRVRSQVDGVLIASPLSPMRGLAKVMAGGRAVVLNRGNRSFPSVIFNHAQALHEAGELLLGLGHTRVALLRGPSGSWAARRRADAVQKWAASSGADLVELGPFAASFEGGLDAAARLGGSGATAAFAFDDLMACGVVAGLTERGVRVPDAFSVVGCDDVLLSRVSTPTLTTLSASLEDLAEAALGLLTEQDAHPSDGAPGGSTRLRTVELPSRLVVRGSTAPAGRPPGFLRGAT